MELKSRLVFGLVALSGIALAGSLALSDPRPDNVDASWKAVAASGRVEARPSGAEEAGWERVRRGRQLAPQSVVRTGSFGRVTLSRGGDLILVDPGTTLELPVYRARAGENSVVQSSGTVVYEIDGRVTRDFEVVTPYLVAGVKGTVFTVSVGEGAASIGVDEGVVEVTSRLSGQTLELFAGDGVTFDLDAADALERASADEVRDLARRRSETARAQADRNRDSAASRRDSATRLRERDERKSHDGDTVDRGPSGTGDDESFDGRNPREVVFDSDPVGLRSDDSMDDDSMDDHSMDDDSRDHPGDLDPDDLEATELGGPDDGRGEMDDESMDSRDDDSLDPGNGPVDPTDPPGGGDLEPPDDDSLDPPDWVDPGDTPSTGTRYDDPTRGTLPPGRDR